MTNKMLDKNYEYNYLSWDTNYFGIKSAKINLYGIVNETTQNEIIKLSNDYKFITISNLNNLRENNYWIGKKTNAFLTDINIQFNKNVQDKSSYYEKNVYIINNHPHNKEIMDIARKSFVYSRFFNDPNLPRIQVENIYSHWTKSAFNRHDKYFVVYKRKQNIMGYILFSLNQNTAIIELIAVAESYQGKGIAKSLIETMESFLRKREIYKINVGTQVENISAIQFYNRIGFTYISCRSIYHWWFESKNNTLRGD